MWSNFINVYLLFLIGFQAEALMKSGWVEMNNGYQYALTTEKFSYEKARMECQGLKGDLAHVGIRDRFVFKKLTQAFLDIQLWVGLDDIVEEGKMVWNDKMPIEDAWHEFWHNGQPNNRNNEDCVSIYSTPCGYLARRLIDAKCTKTLYGICERKLGTLPSYSERALNDFTYSIITSELSHNYSEKLCGEWGGYLAVQPVVNQSVAKFLFEELYNPEAQKLETWVGLNDKKLEGQLSFDSQNSNPSLAAVSWDPTTSNDDAKDCVVFLPRLQRVRMVDCNSVNIFICEKQASIECDKLPKPCHPNASECDKDNTFRTEDGMCNNLLDPQRGRANRALKRLIPAAYDDGVGSPRGTNKLPSARAVTQVLRDATDPASTLATNYLPAWGQLLAHDLALTESNHDESLECPCDDSEKNSECSNIQIPEGDPMRAEKTCITFKRSATTKDVNCKTNVREQNNVETSYYDASEIYGSTRSEVQALRTATSTAVTGHLLFHVNEGSTDQYLPLRSEVPPDFPVECPLLHPPATPPCFVAGDIRVNEQPPLAANHLTWFRFHNNLVDRLKVLNSHWNGEKLYQTARKIIIGILQHITFNEFLPMVLGEDLINRFKLKPTEKGYYFGHDSEFDATISNSFTTAAFRFGHTLVNGNITKQSAEYQTVEALTLHKHFFNSQVVNNTDGPGSLMRGLSTDSAMKADAKFSKSLLDHLFALPNKYGADLPALNIQRGRDHGLPSYLDYRRMCGLAATLDDIPNKSRTRLLEIYQSEEDIDLYIGGVAEKPITDGFVGPLFGCIIGYQFRDLRKGDSFWHENGGLLAQFTPDQLQSIKALKLSRVLCDVGDTITTIQPNVMKQHTAEGNARVPCADLVELDLMPWEEVNGGYVERKASIETEWTPWIPILQNKDDLPLRPENILLRVVRAHRPDDVCEHVLGTETRIVNCHYQVRFKCPVGSVKGTDFPALDASQAFWSEWSSQANIPEAPHFDDEENLAGSAACLKPIAIQAQTTNGVPARVSGDVFEILSPQEGLLCRGKHQKKGKCNDYRVRYLCAKD